MGNRIKKIIKAAAAWLCAMTLGGCSVFGLDARSLMRPPRPVGEQAGIYSLLETAGGADFTLCYPETGDFLSAILQHDLDGDGKAEALAFYQTDATATRVLFGKEDGDGAWRAIGTFENQALQVDRVCFGDLDGDGCDEAVVGWGSSSSGSNTISFYKASDGAVAEGTLEQTYRTMGLLDFDGDGAEELFLAYVPADAAGFTAALYRVSGLSPQLLGQLSCPDSVQQFSATRLGFVAPGVPGAMLDCSLSDGSTVTELFYWDPERAALAAPLSDTAQQNITQRSIGVSSTDFDGDGVLEFPVVSRLPGYTGSASDDVGSVVQWTRLESLNGDYATVATVVQNAADGYTFSLPEAWRGAVTSDYESAGNLLTLSLWDAGQNEAGAPLLRIRAFSAADWQAGTGTAGYTEVLASGGRVIACAVPDPGNESALGVEDLKPLFRPIVWEG